MQYETSAGGVIIAFAKNKIFLLLLKDKSNQWTFPKGLVEKGEDKLQAATREIREEVSLTQVSFISKLLRVNYYYIWEGKLIYKTVHYLLFKGNYSEKPKPQRVEGILDSKWYDLEKASTIIGYPKTNQQVLQKLKHVIKNKFVKIKN